MTPHPLITETRAWTRWVQMMREKYPNSADAEIWARCNIGTVPPRWQVGQYVFGRYYDALQFAEWQASLDDIDAVMWDASMYGGL